MHTAGERRLRDDASIPDLCDEIVLADDAVAIADQEDQEVEGLRCKGDQVSPATQLAAVRVERIVVEQIAQGLVPGTHSDGSAQHPGATLKNQGLGEEN